MESFGDVAAAVRAKQRAWAEGRGLSFDSPSRLLRPEDNIFRGLSAEVRRALEAGRGGELGAADNPGKLAAPHSSAALAINFFQRWLGADVASLAKALKVPTGFDLVFEAQHPTGNRGAVAHLDVELVWKDESRVLGIESKFLETLAPHAPLRASYLSNKALTDFWGKHPCLHSLAEAASQDDCGGYEHVDAAQLIKHCLALLRVTPKAALMLLWYDFSDFGERGAGASRKVRSEVEKFADAVGDDIKFSAMTYQQVFARLERATNDGQWVDYLRARYFASAATT